MLVRRAILRTGGNRYTGEPHLTVHAALAQSAERFTRNE